MQRPSENAEEQLIGFIQSLESAKLGWQAVHLRLSRLSPSNQREYSVRIALNGLNDLIRRHDGRIFLFNNSDVMVLIKGAMVSEVNEAVFQVKFLFQEDPLARDDKEFSAWYDLSINYRELLQAAQGLLRDKIRRKADEEQSAQQFGEVEPLDPNRLFKLQMALTSIDLSAYMRRQPVCVMTAGHKPEPVFEEIYVRIADLQKPLMPNVNFLGNRWLFQHLTQTLDLRVLALMARRPAEFIKGATSINLNVDTLLSQSFLDFDESLKADAQQAVVIEIQAFDVFADLRAFEFGRQFARNKGYRLCLDGLSPKSFTLFDREQLGFDLLKLYWDESLGDSADTAHKDRLMAAVETAGTDRVILSRCDDEHAIQFGYTLGVNMFQGRYVDQVLDPGARPRN